MKKLSLWMLVMFLFAGCMAKPVIYELPPTPKFRMGDKGQLTTLAAQDKLLVEDYSDASKTKHTTMADIDTYLSSIYQPLTAYLTDLADGNITLNFINEAYPWADNEVADDLTIAKLQFDHNVETLAANKTLVITDKVIQKLDPDGTDRDVLLPAEATATDLVFFIYNMGGETGEDLNIQDDASGVLAVIGYEQIGICTCDGTTWTVSIVCCSGSCILNFRGKEENTSNIVTGQPVYISGATGAAFPNYGLADCDNSSKIRVKGLAAEDVTQNTTGYVRIKGLLESVDSTKGNAVNPNSEDWTAGDQLWVSTTAGGLTNVRPLGRSIKIGTVLTVEGANSKILVDVRENSIYTGVASGEDIVRQMGDSAGANKISYTDFAGNEVASLDSDGNATLTGNISAATYGSNSSVTDAELLYINTLASNAQDQFDARCLESVFGLSLKDRLTLNGTALDVSAVLEKYHGIDPSADVLVLLGSANNTIILSNIGAEIDVDVQAYDADLTTYAGITPSADVQAMLGSANDTALRTEIGLAIGSDVQAYDSTLTDIADGTINENLVNEAYPWADNETSNTLTLDLLQLSILTSAPSSPAAGRIYFADNDTWDPCDIAGTDNYYCIYDGTDYIAIMDEDGTFFISSVELPSFSHFATGDAIYGDNSTPHVLTLEEMKGSIITNAGASQDKVYTCQPAGFGMNFMVMVITAHQMDLEPDGNETLWLNGSQMAAAEHIQNTADTKGDIMSCWSVESGDGTYEIFCKSDNANWAEATP